MAQQQVSIPDVGPFVSNLITWSAPVAAFVAVDTFLLPGTSLVPGFLEPFAGWMIAIGAAAFVYRKVK